MLILASASPRRADLLRAANIPFTIQVSPDKEPSKKPTTIPTTLWPTCLAHIKATAVQIKIKNQKSKIANPAPIILAADTIVLSHTNLILNKPRNRTHALAMLRSLRGKTHRVITGIALLQADRLLLSSASATCRIKNVSDAFLQHYLDFNLWKGKAGAYGIQDPLDDPFITLLSGDITTVIGLPIPLVKQLLTAFTKDTP